MKKDYIVLPLGFEHIKIYDRTKNRRIKKKQIKKCPLIEVRNQINKVIGNEKDNIIIHIGGVNNE